MLNTGILGRIGENNSLIFQPLYISRKGVALGYIILLNIRKSYMGSPATPSDLTLSDFENSDSRSIRF